MSLITLPLKHWLVFEDSITHKNSTHLFDEMNTLRVAILDMYKGAPNQGMRNIHNLLDAYEKENQLHIEKHIFDVRNKHEVPDMSFDFYLSTGGPESPIDIEGWEGAYMNLIHDIISHNKTSEFKKYLFLICHSFQVVCHHLKLGTVCKRQRETFGIFPMHKTHFGEKNSALSILPEPFYAVDSRKWQVTQPDHEKLDKMGAQIVAIEKIRHHVPLERATMAIQFTPEIFGTQFHPEADPEGMRYYLTQEKKQIVIDTYGQEKYDNMLFHLEDPDKLLMTRNALIPHFIDLSVEALHNKEIKA